MGQSLRSIVVQDYIDIIVVVALRLSEDSATSQTLVASAAYELVSSVIGALGLGNASARRRASTFADNLFGAILARLESVIATASPEYNCAGSVQSVLQLQLLGLMCTALRYHGPSWNTSEHLHKTLSSVLAAGLMQTAPGTASLARSYWISFACTSLPYQQAALPLTVASTLGTLCLVIAEEYERLASGGALTHSFSSELGFVLDGISQIISFCTLDNERGLIRTDSKSNSLQV